MILRSSVGNEKREITEANPTAGELSAYTTISRHWAPRNAVGGEWMRELNCERRQPGLSCVVL